MKVLLLNPPYLKRFSRQSRSPSVTKSGTFYYPYFLAYTTGVLEQVGFDVKLIDAVAKDWTRKETVDFVKSFEPSLVVIDTSTPSILNDIEVAGLIKKALPNVHINLVGTHPTAVPEEVLKNPDVDSVCRSEYEYTVRDLAKILESKKPLNGVIGLSYREGKRIVHNSPRPLIANLDELPFVSAVYKKHLNIRDYFYASLTYPQITILTARGCPYNCSFCNAPFKCSYRPRSIENVVAELEFIKKELPEVREVMIEDETFPASKERTLKLCNLIVERGIKLKWSCNARVNTDLETLKAMKRAGCRLMCVGFETPKKEVLENIRKGTTSELQLQFMADTRKAGLLVNGCFILGLPGDTKESMAETIKFAKRLNPDTAQFYPLMVYPGTEAFVWASRAGYLKTTDYSKWLTPGGLHTTVVSTPQMESEELVKLCDQARREFYTRKGYVLGKIKQSITNPSEAVRIIKSAKQFIKYLKNA